MVSNAAPAQYGDDRGVETLGVRITAMVPMDIGAHHQCGHGKALYKCAMEDTTSTITARSK
jgi:hypothetical protein